MNIYIYTYIHTYIYIYTSYIYILYIYMEHGTSCFSMTLDTKGSTLFYENIGSTIGCRPLNLYLAHVIIIST
jgi:hypothetical protein